MGFGAPNSSSAVHIKQWLSPMKVPAWTVIEGKTAQILPGEEETFLRDMRTNILCGMTMSLNLVQNTSKNARILTVSARVPAEM